MAVPRRYEIRLFDRPLVEFAVSDGLMGPDIELSDYDSTALPLMPCGLSLTPEGIRTWLEIRSIPTNRRNAARICRELGFKELPCYVFKQDTPVEKLCEYTIKDNVAFGNIDWELIANEWDTGDVQDWGLDCSFLGGNEDVDIDKLFEEKPKEEKVKDLKIEVTFPPEMEEQQAEIKAAIEAALAGYENVKVK